MRGSLNKVLRSILLFIHEHFKLTWVVKIPQNRVCWDPVDNKISIGRDRCIEAAIWRDQVVTVPESLASVESVSWKVGQIKQPLYPKSQDVDLIKSLYALPLSFFLDS